MVCDLGASQAQYFDDDGDSGTVTNFSTDTAYHTSDLQPNEEVTFTSRYTLLIRMRLMQAVLRTSLL